MTRALLTLQVWTARNLARQAWRWLARPLHALFAAGVGGAILVSLVVWCTTSAVLTAGWWGRPLVLGGVTLALFQLTLGAWLFPSRTGLAFFPGEVSLLFPAPLSRAALIWARILTAQPGTFLLAVLLGMPLPAAPGGRAGAIVGAHLILTFLYLNRLAVSLASVPRPATGRPGPTRALVAAALAAAMAVLSWHLPGAELWEGIGLDDLLFGVEPALRTLSERAGRWAAEGPQALVLAPFRALAELVAPAADEGGRGWGWQLLVALPVVAAPWLYCVHGRAPFMEAALQASEVWQLRLEQLRATGRWQDPTRGAIAPPPLRLGLLPGPVWALAWKGLAGITRVSLRRYAIGAACLIGLALFAIRAPALRPYCFSAALVTSGGVGLALMFVGELQHPDLRATLRHPAWWKTLPLAGWRVFLGEILATTAASSCVGALLLVLTAILVDPIPGAPPPFLRAMATVGAILGLVPTIALLVALTNAAAVISPRVFGAWPPRGVIDLLGAYAVLIARTVLLGIAAGPALLAGSLGLAFGVAVAGTAGVPLGGLAWGLVLSAITGLVVALAGAGLDRLEPAGE